jgi:hypothetical protein
VAHQGLVNRARAVWIAPALVGVGLLVVSQSVAWYGDEGFHLVAAQLVNAGRTPYLDFLYVHPTTYLYVCAAWMRVFGESWRSAHALSAICSAAGVGLVSAFVFTRVPDARWRLTASAAAAAFVGLNVLVLRFGTIGQPYGFCLVLVIGSAWLAMAASERPRGSLPLLAGLSAGAAASASLLASPAVLLEAGWLFWYSSAADRSRKSASFLAGALLPWLPTAWLAVKSPATVFFDIVQYQVLHRATLTGSPGVFVPTRETMVSQLRVLTSWLIDAPSILLLILAGIGLLSLRDQLVWSPRRRAEAYLCLWLIVGMGLFSSIPYRTFSQYFVFVVPFLSILAAFGLFAIGSRIWPSGRPALLTLAVVGLLFTSLGKTIYRDPALYQRRYWRDLETIAGAVNQVTPPNGGFYSDMETAYVTTGRLPAAGLESSYAAELTLPPSQAAVVHAVPQAEIDRWLSGGRFDTVLMFDEDARVEALGLPERYNHSREFDRPHAWLFWDPRK